MPIDTAGLTEHTGLSWARQCLHPLPLAPCQLAQNRCGDMDDWFAAGETQQEDCERLLRAVSGLATIIKQPRNRLAPPLDQEGRLRC